MSLFGSLYVGASGLQTSQNALNTTAHNMSNVDTTGYTRQQVQLGTRFYNTISRASAVSAQQIGLGVNYSRVKQIRDYFLDKTYRRESGRSAFYDVSVTTVEEIEDLFQELEGEAFAGSIDNLWGAVQELSKYPNDSVRQGSLVQRCSEFITRASAVYQGLKEYQDNINYKVQQQVDTVNAYGKRIAELNAEILKIEAGKVEKANDLRDERNQLIDELASMVNIDCRDDVDGNILISVEGNAFVKSDSANEMLIDIDPSTGFYTPYWKQLADHDENGKLTNLGTCRVFNMKQIISTDGNTDIGSLKSLLFARGDRRATYQDLEEPVYSEDISQSLVMNVQAEFDQLIHKITTKINEVLEEAALKQKALDPDSDYLMDADGKPYQMFKTKAEAGGYTVDNVIINGTLQQSPSLLGFKKGDKKVDQELADALKNVFEEEVHTLNPNVKTPTNFINYYNNLISQVANTGYVFKGICENQQMEVESVGGAREQILGVSSDEEMSNMIMFQNAYNASSRYINVVSELMEHIISTLGR